MKTMYEQPEIHLVTFQYEDIMIMSPPVDVEESVEDDDDPNFSEPGLM